MAATIRDIAKEAGVSVATVSRLINKSGYVGARTAARVQDAIERLGFRSNAIGRSLSTAKTRTFGVIVPALSNPVFAEAVSGVTACARRAGYHVMITATNYDSAEELATVGTFLEQRVDAMILTVANAGKSPALDLLDTAALPYVLIYNEPPCTGRPAVTIDNAAAGAQVAEVLQDLGHRRLAMISGRFAESNRASARRDGFLAGARSAGLAMPSVREVDFIALNVDAVLKDLFDDPATAPTALFCSNDLLAISVIGALDRMGLAVPQNVSVIGFDGIAIGTHLHPTLATVIQPSREMGEVAAQYLLHRLAGEKATPPCRLPFTLRLGESAGPAGNARPADLQDPANPREGDSHYDR
ncbi:MAG: LacI family DNA-binding transcriptional regulator [Pseudomonadota bacterium]